MYRDFSKQNEDKLLNMVLCQPGQHEDQTFAGKLHGMLLQSEKEGWSHIVSWHVHGRCFSIRDSAQFEEKVLPLWFRTSRLSSFKRQLSHYGFNRLKTGRDKGGYFNEMFLRGKKFLSHRIQRCKKRQSNNKHNNSSEPDFYSMSFLPATTLDELLTNTNARVDAISTLTKAVAAPNDSIKSLLVKSGPSKQAYLHMACQNNECNPKNDLSHGDLFLQVHSRKAVDAIPNAGNLQEAPVISHSNPLPHRRSNGDLGHTPGAEKMSLQTSTWTKQACLENHEKNKYYACTKAKQCDNLSAIDNKLATFLQGSKHVCLSVDNQCNNQMSTTDSLLPLQTCQNNEGCLGISLQEVPALQLPSLVNQTSQEPKVGNSPGTKEIYTRTANNICTQPTMGETGHAFISPSKMPSGINGTLEEFLNRQNMTIHGNNNTDIVPGNLVRHNDVTLMSQATHYDGVENMACLSAVQTNKAWHESHLALKEPVTPKTNKIKFIMPSSVELPENQSLSLESVDMSGVQDLHSILSDEYLLDEGLEELKMDDIDLFSVFD